MSKCHRFSVKIDENLTATDLRELRRLFDNEYLDDFGPWDAEQPYGYAPHDVHIIAKADGHVVGHVGWARREITVGGETVVIAGVGGVLVSHNVRGHRLGADLMQRAAQSIRAHEGIEFGYLGCREEVVPFYLSCGWSRICVGERSLGRTGEPVVDPPGQPILILPIAAPLEAWPDGDVDLRGRAW